MTKKEREIIAAIRNQFSPLLNYFAMREDVRTSDLREHQKEDLYAIIEKEDETAQGCSKKIKELLDSLG